MVYSHEQPTPAHPILNSMPMLEIRKNLCWLLLALATSAQALDLAPLQQQGRAAHLATELLSRYHYKALPLNDEMSEKIFDRYLKSLDSEKYFFIQSDIKQFAGARTRLDDAIIEEDLSAPFAIFNQYTRRVVERFAYGRSLLKTGFDFSQKEGFEYNRENAVWPKSDDEIRELWRKRVKNDWLRLKLAGKDDKGIRETLDKRYEASIRRVGRLKSEDAFQIFMNAYTMSIEPHTNYLGPRAAENFDISMKLSLVGIGALLEEKDEYTTIRELIPGGPAALSGKLKAGDRIVGVGQGRNAPLTDVFGWRLDDTVSLIRGATDSVVLLDILPADAGPDGKHKLVPLIRKKITLDEQAAKKSIIAIRDGETTRRIGVITLPTFYQDFVARQKGDRNFRSAARDVTRLLEELKKENVASVLIDLRNNGGGSLTEAVELTGLFIDRGPVVQQRDADGKITVESDTRAGVTWDGRLGVLINRGSASASEIFAAAIQDYGRGIVIGEPSFGKGTVQTMLDLDRIGRSDKAQFGELKMTVAQFFRVNGGTTQLRGVEPDIRFPTLAELDKQGESAFDNALPWGQIVAADYSPSGNAKNLLTSLQSRHASRVGSDPDFRDLQEDMAEFRRLRSTNSISLNEAERRLERTATEARQAARSARRNGEKTASGKPAKGTAEAVISEDLLDDGLEAGERKSANDLSEAKARKEAADFMLREAARILSDEVAQSKADTPRPDLAARGAPLPSGALTIPRSLR
ncbi:carboxy terminal-processing peptidase [Dechloromonas sp. A34]|uniref:carboxy terminal-processing peptidase n=1 Tax=Dechloromonas sp. A34 TaxID=447588 RepID=UPI00224993FB|nr:carboxy terminal-processing peptidase [Dechloromonas sp. A34]